MNRIGLLSGLLCALLAGGCAAGGEAFARDSWTKRQGGISAGDKSIPLTGAVERLQIACPLIKLHVHVLEKNDLSAYVWPDGHIYVSRELAARATEEQLAAAMAHEIGHLLDKQNTPPPSALAPHFTAEDLREYRADQLGRALLVKAGYSDKHMASLLRLIQADPTNSPELCARIARRLDRL